MEQVKSGNIESQPMPHDHAKNLCTYHSATPETVQAAIDGALAAKPEWEDMPWADRAAIFLKAADLIAGKYRFEVMAATMLGQGKNAWQAEIDAAAEVILSLMIHDLVADRQTIDFLRFSVKYVEQLYAIQPPRNSQGVWK
jgi:1-pyrroline-5-carboxylate dehydrogenase